MARTIGRREFLLTAFATSLLRPAYSKVSASGHGTATVFGPEANAIKSNEAVKPLVIPNGDFFVRNHFAAPALMKGKWTVSVRPSTF